MPGYTLKDGRHFVSLVTGPAHVLLGVRFTREAAEPALVGLPARDGRDHGALDEREIEAAVREVLAGFRAEGADLHAAEIVYVEDDSPDYALYREAARLLAARYLAGGEFRAGV